MWVSPYTRTRETASIINEKIGVKKVKEDITLIEQQYGLFSDKEIEKIKTMYPNNLIFMIIIIKIMENSMQNFHRVKVLWM